jgi:ACS family tartrate transporter-like MFS transporter
MTAQDSLIRATEISTETVGRRTLKKISWRLLPLLGLGYGIAYMDRTNISYAALQMNQDLGFSATIYGLGGGLFFLSYALLEVPSNLMLMRFGARRWLARIMLTWGVLAAGMMLVKTPAQFYAMRFLLGAAEAGFFPGVVFFLMYWFPAYERGRAISRFYVALPLSMVVMGVVASALLNMHGHLRLAGWQWLFLVEGLPAVVLGVAFLALLPNRPAEAKWLTLAERSWIENRLAADRVAPGVSPDHGVLRALRDSRVVLLGVANVFVIGGNYAFSLSAPTLLIDATHLDATRASLLTAAAAALGAVGMIAAGWYSDRRRERHLHLIVYMLVLAGAYGAMWLSPPPWLFALSYAVSVVSFMATQAVYFSIPSDVLRGRSAAAGIAAIGSIGMVGSFIGPYAWGLSKDFTGTYRAGLLALAAAYLCATAIIVILRRNARIEQSATRLATTVVS